MFFPRATPVSIAPAHVRGLRISLNTPVVTTSELPIGPARAAILLHEEPGRGETVTIGIRSLRAERTALYALEGDGETSLDLTLDAALTFAESMGFLFDEDELGDGGAQAKTRALGLWRDLLGEANTAPTPTLARARGTTEAELLLEDTIEESTEVAVLPSDSDADSDRFLLGEEDAEYYPGWAAEQQLKQPEAQAEPEPEVAPTPLGADRSDASDAAAVEQAARAAAGATRRAAPTLTKFRGGAPAKPARAAAPEPAPQAAAAPEGRAKRPAALGRLRLVRKVKDGIRKRNPIVRLFGAF